MSLAESRLRLLCAWYLMRRGLTGSRHRDVRRMRELKDAFYRRSWQKAVAMVGAEMTALSDNIAEIAKAGRRLRVCGRRDSMVLRGNRR